MELVSNAVATVYEFMLDKYVVPVIRPGLRQTAIYLHKFKVKPDQLTVAGFLVGLACIPLLAWSQHELALICLVLNRLADGIDGELARLDQSTDAGSFLDITLDFIFYAIFPLGFALQDPANNALPAAILIASFVGTGASFLAFASQAAKHDFDNPWFAYKGLFYLNGLAEGTETIMIFVIMCLLPGYFEPLAYGFSAICFITCVNRVVFGYQTLKNNS